MPRQKLPRGLFQWPGGGYYTRSQRHGKDVRIGLGSDLTTARQLLREHRTKIALSYALGVAATSSVEITQSAGNWRAR